MVVSREKHEYIYLIFHHPGYKMKQTNIKTRLKSDNSFDFILREVIDHHTINDCQHCILYYP